MDGSDPAENAVTIVRELEKYSPELAGKPRWLVFNKMDLILEEEAQEVMDRVKAALNHEGPVYAITAISKEGTKKVCYDILDLLDTMPRQLAEDARDAIEKVEFKWDDYHKNQLAKAEADAWRRPRPSMMAWTMTTGTMRTTTASKSFTFAIEHHVQIRPEPDRLRFFYGRIDGVTL